MCFKCFGFFVLSPFKVCFLFICLAFEFQKLEAELNKAFENVKSQTEENKMLSDLLNSKIDESSDEAKKNLLRENVALKKDVSHLVVIEFLRVRLHETAWHLP